MTDYQLTLRLIRELGEIMNSDFPSEADFEKAIDDKVDEIKQKYGVDVLAAIGVAAGVAAVVNRRVNKSTKSTFN